MKSFLFFSLLINLLYAIFLLVVGQVYNARWFSVMAIYYGVLFGVRAFVFFQLRQTRLQKKILIMRTCGCFLFLINLVVSSVMFLLIHTAQRIKHHEIVVITLALYTFSTLTLAIVGGIKYFKKNDHIYTCIKVVSLISASVSMVALTNTMLATFGGDEITTLRKVILPIVSGVVAVFILACAILMIVKANRDLGVLRNEEKRE